MKIYVKLFIKIYLKFFVKVYIKLFVCNKIYFQLFTTDKIFPKNFAPMRSASAMPLAKMARKKKTKTAMEYLRYLGLGFVLEESSSMSSAKNQASGIQFVPSTAHVIPMASGKIP